MTLCKNVIVNGRRTSMRLKKEEWLSLSDICWREKITLNNLCSKIDSIKGKAGLSSEIRLFILTYFQNKLNEYEREAFSFQRKNKFNKSA